MRTVTVILAAAALVCFAAPAFAGEPDGSFTFKDNTVYDQSNLVGQYSSRIIQNGQFVGGNHGATIDQTTTPGSRAAAVQALQAAQGRGSVNNGK